MPEFPLPVSTAILKTHLNQDDPFSWIASLQPDDAKQAIRKVWEAIEHPVLRRIADEILEVPLMSLSTIADRSYLGFKRWGGSGLGSTFWIAALKMDIPKAVSAGFPLGRFDPLEEFLIYLGGLRDWPSVDHSGDFLDPRDFHLISATDSGGCYGRVDDWEGALQFYQGGSGDMIVLAPDGRVGAFFHEYAADEAESPFHSLDYSFADLLSHYADYIRLPKDSPERKDSPFYY